MVILKSESRLVHTQLEMNKYIGQRKHYSQLSTAEVERINKRLMDIENWEVSRHTFDRLKEKGINATIDDIISVINNSSIIEYKIDYISSKNRNEERVVLRAKDVVNKFYNLNVVYSLTSGTIITVWMNHVKDSHNTLDWSIYNPDMKVF